jgi:hypothetical protein
MKRLITGILLAAFCCFLFALPVSADNPGRYRDDIYEGDEGGWVDTYNSPIPDNGNSKNFALFSVSSISPIAGFAWEYVISIIVNPHENKEVSDNETDYLTSTTSRRGASSK